MIPALRRLALALCAIALTACASVRTPPAAVGPVAAAERGQTMISDRLFFGRNVPTGGTVSDSEWAAFLAEEVTPRFPDGLTVFQGEGQWTDPRGTLVHERTIVLQVDHLPGPAADSSVAAIAQSYRVRFHQDAVLRISDTVQVRFYRGSPP